MSDDWDYGRDIELERERDYEHEIAVSQYLDDIEDAEYERRRRQRDA